MTLRQLSFTWQLHFAQTFAVECTRVVGSPFTHFTVFYVLYSTAEQPPVGARMCHDTGDDSICSRQLQFGVRLRCVSLCHVQLTAVFVSRVFNSCLCHVQLTAVFVSRAFNSCLCHVQLTAVFVSRAANCCLCVTCS